MKPQCKLRPNNEVMEVLMMNDCPEWFFIRIEKRVRAIISSEKTERLSLNLNYCQDCDHWLGESPEWIQK